MSKIAAVSLKVMAENKLAGVSKTTNFAVDPNKMEVEDGFNGRPLDPEHVESIATAYANGAVLPALEVRVDQGRIIIVDGHHRHAGALLAISRGAEILALDCRQFRGSDADRVMHMISSAQGKPLTPLQLGVQYRKMIGYGWKVPAIAARCGKSSQHVSDMVALAESNTDVQQAVTDNKVSARNALKIVREHGDQAGAVINKAVDAAKATGKTKATAKHIDPPKPGWPKEDRVATVRHQISCDEFVAAIRREMETKGKERCDVTCPQFADLVVYLRTSSAEALPE